MTVLLIIIAVLLAANLAVNMMWLGVITTAIRAEKPQKQEIPATSELSAKDPLDEGFDNIMRYSVGGKTGFEADE